jgi:shikimate kinase
MFVALIGYRGTGKTTVARLLALRLGWPWFDADVEIERRAGKSIAAIFAEQGEAAFRDQEAAVLNELTSREQIVIACGGGAVLRDETRRRLNERGMVIWLRATPATIGARVAADATTAARRPQLTTQGGAAEVEQLLAERTPHYQSCAHIEIDTEGKTPPEIAAAIVDELRRQSGIVPLENA